MYCVMVYLFLLLCDILFNEHVTVCLSTLSLRHLHCLQFLAIINNKYNHEHS